jgi:hypothetical protein
LIIVDMPNGFPFVGSFPYLKGTSYCYWPLRNNVGLMPNVSLVHISPMAPIGGGIGPPRGGSGLLKTTYGPLRGGDCILRAIGRLVLDKVWKIPMEHQMDHEMNPLDMDHQVGHPLDL